MAPAVLCYWDIRGLAQPIRLLLEYTGTEYEDRQLACGPAPTFDKSGWFDSKHTLGLSFPNLPYYKDEDVSLTQSNTILKHIGRKNNLDGNTLKEKAEADMCADQIMDLRNGWVRLCYNDKFDTLKAGYLEGLTGQLRNFSTFLGVKSWLVGEQITYPDFHLYEMLTQHKMLKPDCLKEFPNLEEYCTRFEKLPAIEKYMQTDRFMKAPINNKMAAFGDK
jgi:glutathione S-transferase